jgi:oligosaccharyltransferase complex subunit delta (ribophorin II)
VQFLTGSNPIDAEIVIGSFGASDPYHKLAFQLSVNGEGKKSSKSDDIERYGKLPEIHHIFKEDPQSPAVFLTLIFLLATLITIPVLAGSVC